MYLFYCCRNGKIRSKISIGASANNIRTDEKTAPAIVYLIRNLIRTRARKHAKTAPACGDGLIDSKQNQIVYFNAFCGAFANSARFSS